MPGIVNYPLELQPEHRAVGIYPQPGHIPQGQTLATHPGHPPLRVRPPPRADIMFQ